ncbi:MAG: hypothetical protein J0M02_14005 [Planctomycetes bacterium]|nr:hypothetical protein [Planctomycetota bacterium]
MRRSIAVVTGSLLLLGGCGDEPASRTAIAPDPVAPVAAATAAAAAAASAPVAALPEAPVVWRWKAQASAPDGRVGATGDGWNTLITAPPGTLKGGHEYLAELRYRVIAAPPYPGNPFFGSFHMFARSKTLGQERDVWQNWLGDPGDQGVVRMPMVLAPVDDWTFSVGCKGAGTLIVESLVIRAGTGFAFVPATPDAQAPAAAAVPVATGCGPIVIDPPVAGTGVQVSVAEFGMLPDAAADDAAAAANAVGLARAFKACAERKASRLLIPPGTYRMAPKDPLSLSGLQDLAIEATGAELVYTTLLRNASVWNLVNCQRLAVRGLSIDWDWSLNPIASVARVDSLADDRRSAVLSFPDLAAATVARVKDAAWSGMTRIDPQTMRGTGSQRLSPKPATREIAADGAIHATFSEPLALEQGNHYLIRHLYYEMGAFKINDSSHLLFDGVTVYSVPGMGWVCRGDLHHLALRRCAITIKPGTRRAYSTSADGFHVLDSQGSIAIEDSEITGTGDDCINIHDNNAQGVRKEGPSTLALINNPRWRMKVAVGDTLELFRADYAPVGWTGKVAKVLFTGNDAVVDFAQPLPETVSPLSIVFNRRYGTADVRIARNRFDHGRVMVSARRATIEDNRMEHPAANAIQLATEIAGNLWSEGSGNEDIVIRRNTIIGANAIGKFGGPAIHAVPVLPAGRTSYPLFRRILIEDNRLIDCHGPFVQLGACADVVVRGNRIEADAPVAGANALAGCIKAECATRLHLGGNTWKAGAGQAKPGVLWDPATCSAVEAAGNRIVVE